MAAAPPPTDKTIRIARFFSYPKTLVYVLVTLLALVSVVHSLRLFLRVVLRRASSTSGRSRTLSDTRRTRNSKRAWTRWPLAAGDWLRATSMRRTVSLCWGAQLSWLEVAMTLGYMALLLGFVFAGTTTLEGQRVEPHYYANRAGTVAATQFPIMTALGMRNNPFSWLTGVSFDKLNYLHRMTARVLVIIVWIHAAGRLTVGLLDDETINHPWVRAGFLTASTLTLLVVLTFRPVRTRAYEVFMAIHFVGAGITLLALLKHLSGRSLTAYGAWPSLLLWGVDRSLRGVQYLVYNYPYIFSCTRARRECDAEVEVLRVRGTGPNTQENDGDEPRFLRISLTRPGFRWRAGQSAFLAFPTVGLSSAGSGGASSPGAGDRMSGGAHAYASSMIPRRAHPFQSHPFTIMAQDGSAPGGRGGLASLFGWFSRNRSDADANTSAQEGVSDEGSASGHEKQGSGDATESDTTHASNSALGTRPRPGARTLVFVVRVRDGMTRALWDRAAASGRAARDASMDVNVDIEKGSSSSHSHSVESGTDYGGTGLKCTVPVLISGPYSNPPVLVGYQTVMLIAGGTGVAFTLPLFLDVIERAKRGERSCEQLVFIWAVRDTDHLKWIEDSVSQAVTTAPPDTPLSIRFLFCVTGTDEDAATALPPGRAPDMRAETTGDETTEKESTEEKEDPWTGIGSPTTPTSQAQASGKLVSLSGAETSEMSMLQLPGARLVKTKPPIRRLIQQELAQCQGRMSVNVCGTPSLANAVREALSAGRMGDVMSYGPTVTLHVEAFGG